MVELLKISKKGKLGIFSFDERCGGESVGVKSNIIIKLANNVY